MRLCIDPTPSIPQLSEELEIVILIAEGLLPEVFSAEGLPKPDRHLVLGLMQTAALAIGERDSESVFVMKNGTARLEKAGKSIDMRAPLVVVKTTDGRFGVLVSGEPASATRLARHAVRWFTGTVRLDVP